MKKLMIAAVAAFAVGGIFAADSISSANTVGYLTKTFDTTNPSMGGMFISISSETGTWKLNDWKVEGMDPASDCLQILNPADASVDYAVTYVNEFYDSEYFGGDGSMVGWWTIDFATPIGDTPFAAEQAFLCNFGNEISFTYAGEVNSQSAPKVSFVDLVNPMLCNFLPREISYKELAVTGIDPASDCLQVLSPADASVDYAVTYVNSFYDSEYFGGDGSMVGWWTIDFATPMDNETIKAGEAFLCNFGNNIEFTFPAAISK